MQQKIYLQMATELKWLQSYISILVKTPRSPEGQEQTPEV